MPTRRSLIFLTYAVFFGSGIAGLGYQIVWARMFSVGLGHEMPSVFAVVAAFFGGLAIGALFLDKRISRSPLPGHWYAALELVIGLWALATIALIPWINTIIHDLVGVDPSPVRHWSVSFLVPFLALLPATAAMGATLPAMDRFVSAIAQQGRTIGGIYAVNTLGAAAGVLASTFFIIPSLGYRATVIAFAAINLICAGIILLWPAQNETKREPVLEPVDDALPTWRLNLTLLVTGLLGIGYEVLGVRVMAQVLENTVYSYAAALIVYLCFTAIGAALYQRLLAHRAFRPTLAWLVLGLSTACLIGIFVLSEAQGIYESIAIDSGRSFAKGLLAEFVIAALVFAVPTLLMGATFSHLAQAARREAGGVGRALCINTLGGSLAAITFGVLLLPTIGAKWALTIVAVGYLTLLPRWRDQRTAYAIVPLALVIFLPRSLMLVTPPPGGSTLEYREGVMAAVAVVDDPQGNRFLKVNNLFQMGGTTSGFSERRQAHVPLLLHPKPERTLFLGVGTGITAGAATIYPDMQIDAVELLPEIVELIDQFQTENALLTSNPRVNLSIADARRFIRATDQTYDVIVADLYHPARDGSGMLYTREHFSAIADHLAPGGLACQWIPLYQLDTETARLIIRTWLEVFPNTNAFLAHYNVNTPALGLVGSTQPLTFAADWYDRRTAGTGIRNSLIQQRQALYDSFALFGTFVATREQLAKFAGPGPLNTDNRPLVTFRAPEFIYRQSISPYARLQTILAETDRDPAPLFDDSAAPFVAELRQFLEARDVFLAGAIKQTQGDLPAAARDFVRSADLSPRFLTGYLTALQYAVSIAETGSPIDRSRARDILRDLIEANPARPEAREALRQIFGE
ncbi:MAG: spermidine synthase [Phycisphaerales bacterium]